MLLSRLKIVLLACVFLLPATVLRAQTSAPTALAAPSLPADPSTPRGAVKSYVGALQAGDTDKIKSLVATTNPTEDKMVDAMATMAKSQRKFRDAAQAAYGDSAKDLTGETDAEMAAGLAQIDSAPETITGDTATVDLAAVEPAVPGRAPPPPLTLKKIDGHWQIPIGDLARGVDQSTIQQRLDDIGFMSKMMDESADEVSKGMYKTPKDAGEAIKSKIMVAMMKRANPASQATSQPSQPPPMDTPAPAPSTPGM